MRIRELSVVNFRNLKKLDISFPGDVTLITGPNGQGKTSILEAVFYLAHAKSFRTSKPQEAVNWNSPDASCVIEATVESLSGTRTNTFQIKDGKRFISINNKREKKADSFFGTTSCIVFTPYDLELVKGGPVGRRSFLDQVLSMAHAHFIEQLVRYQRILKSRNALLIEELKRKHELSEKSDLSPWNKGLISHGRAIAVARQGLITQLNANVQKYYRLIAARPDMDEIAIEQIKLVYESQLLKDGQILDEMEMVHLYQHSETDDRRRGITTIGIHRDELAIYLSSSSGEVKSARQNASQGQIRSATLALKLAAVDYLLQQTGEPPILLLDDVESELDQYRTRNLFHLISSFNSQVIITSTEATECFKSISHNAQILRINEGRVEVINKS